MSVYIAATFGLVVQAGRFASRTARHVLVVRRLVFLRWYLVEVV